MMIGSGIPFDCARENDADSETRSERGKKETAKVEQIGDGLESSWSSGAIKWISTRLE